ncbi:sensor histidine kinase [Natronospora cellulosivora (SeqCode)]
MELDSLIYISIAIGIITIFLSMISKYYTELDKRLALEMEKCKLAIFEERGIIARELARKIHDSILHNLFLLCIHLNNILINLEEDSKKSVKTIDSLQEIVQEVQSEMLMLKYELRSINEKSFFETLEDMLILFKQRYGIDIVYDYYGYVNRFSDKDKLLIYRLLQEFLNIIAKHISVKCVRVSLNVEFDAIFIDIKDNGKGYEYQNIDKEGQYRINYINEVLKDLGGNFCIESFLSKGNNLFIEIPLASFRLF